MKTLVTMLALMFLATPAVAAEWEAYKSEEGRFTAEFPGKPTKSVDKIETTLGAVEYTTVMAELEGGQVAYGVAFNDFPGVEAGDIDAKAALDGGRDGAKTNLNGKLISETNITFEGYQGREFTIESNVGGQTMFYHTRVYLIGTRLYQLQVIRMGDAPLDAADVVRFFASFKPKV